MTDLFPPDPNLAKGHILVQQRLPALLAAIAKPIPGYPIGRKLIILEIYRSDSRQQWLYGQGREASDLAAKSIPVVYARPGAIVTNAWSAKTSAHGHLDVNGRPAACAVDLMPAEGLKVNPWDDNTWWTAFVGALEPIINKFGFRHFHAPGKAVWDKPHIQLVEWDDDTDTLRT